MHVKIKILFMHVLVVLCMTTNVYGQDQEKQQFVAEFGGPAINYGQIISATLFVIAIIVIVLFLLKKTRLAAPVNQNILDIVHSFSISSKEKLLIVRAGRDYLLLSSSPSGINKIHTINKEDIDENLSGNSLSKNEFSNILLSLVGKNRHA